MTYGEDFSASVGEYLKAYNMSGMGRINGKVLAELADRFHDDWKKSQKLTKRKAQSKFGRVEEEWLKDLEKEPALAGVAIREELARAQFWCKENSRQCNRRFFTNWLNKAERRIDHGGGKETRVKRDIYQEPTNWRTEEVRLRLARRSLMSPETWANVCAREWMDLSPDLRADIQRNML